MKEAPEKHLGCKLADHPSLPARIEVENMNTVRQFWGRSD